MATSISPRRLIPSEHQHFEILCVSDHTDRRSRNPSRCTVCRGLKRCPGTGIFGRTFVTAFIIGAAKGEILGSKRPNYRLISIWYSWVGSNHRPPDPQSGALTKLSYSCTEASTDPASGPD